MNCSVVNDVGSLGSSSEHLHRSCACPRPKYCECSLPAVSRIFEWPLPWPRWFRRRSALLPCHQRLLPQQHAWQPDCCDARSEMTETKVTIEQNHANQDGDKDCSVPLTASIKTDTNIAKATLATDVTNSATTCSYYVHTLNSSPFYLDAYHLPLQRTCLNCNRTASMSAYPISAKLTSSSVCSCVLHFHSASSRVFGVGSCCAAKLSMFTSNDRNNNNNARDYSDQCRNEIGAVPIGTTSALSSSSSSSLSASVQPNALATTDHSSCTESFSPQLSSYPFGHEQSPHHSHKFQPHSNHEDIIRNTVSWHFIFYQQLRHLYRSSSFIIS